MICNKCKVEKELDQYETYWHSTKQKHYTRRICNSCMREGSRLYKQKKKLEKQIPQQKEIIQPVVPESQPEVLQVKDGYKTCSECFEYKPFDEFYKTRAGNPVRLCKDCYKKYHRNKLEKKMVDKGGPDIYHKEPNRYVSDIQRNQVFELMNAFGWIFDESTGVWNKPGLKENGVFINFTPSDKPKRRPGNVTGRKIKKGVWNSVDKIVKLIEEGHDYWDVAETFCCSHTTIRKVISDYRNGKIK